jgi:hypothetical protein
MGYSKIPLIWPLICPDNPALLESNPRPVTRGGDIKKPSKRICGNSWPNVSYPSSSDTKTLGNTEKDPDETRSSRWRWSQYTETNVMHFLFNLLSIKDLYMFWALLAHPQEFLHKRHLVYCVHVTSVGFNPGAANWHNTHSIYKVQVALCRASWGWASDARNM